MAFAKNIMLGGIPAQTADAINGQVATGLTAVAQGTQTTALLVSADYNFVSLASGSGAVRLFAGQNGDSCIITNAFTSSMFVFPPVGAFFQGTATNAAVTLSPNISCKYTCINATTWITELSAGGATA